MISAQAIADKIATVPFSGRRLIAFAGPPASGKSTLAADVVEVLGASARLVPMDGFHLDNRLLEPRHLGERKGAPETFDLGGFSRLVQSLRHDEQVFFPIFDRERDIAIAAADEVDGGIDTVIIEGNYLMFDEPGWRDLADHWDGCLFLDAPMETLRARLIQRWLKFGLPEIEARKRAEGNDLLNAERILKRRLPVSTELEM